MIQPAIFVKVLETSHPRGDRATVNSPAWRVMVCNGDREFFPVSGFSCFDDGYYFDKHKAVDWAKQVASILGDVPVSLFKPMRSVMAWPHDRLPDEFIEDIE